MGDLRTASLWYARRGIRVFPCDPRGKAPLGRLVPNGYHDASADPQTVAAWWDAEPEANIGIPCAPNGLLVGDVDRHTDKVTGEIVDGYATLAELQGDEALPLTPTSDTGGGGMHLVFLRPDYPTKSKAGPGFDIKVNGYIVVGPSVHPSGELYRWRKGLRLGDLQPAPVPPWLEVVIWVQEKAQTEPLQPAQAAAVPAGALLSDREVAVAALPLLPAGLADSYQEWIEVGQALHSVDEGLLAEWIAWSRQSPAFDSVEDCEQHWRSFRTGGGVTVASLINLARQTERDFLRPGWRRAQEQQLSNGNGTGPKAELTAPTPPPEHCEPGAYRLDDIGNAERLTKLQGHRLRWCGDWKRWLVYTSGSWRDDQMARVVSAAQETARSIFVEAGESDESQAEARAKWGAASGKSARLNAMIEQARPHLALVSTDLDRDPYLLNCTNGTVDLRTGQLRRHNPDDLLHNMAGIDYRPGSHLADTPEAREWQQFLIETSGEDPEWIAYVQRALGYAITGDPCEEVVFIAFGDGGTGKGTLFDPCSRSLGSYSGTLDFKVLVDSGGEKSGPSPELDRLQSARFVPTSESNRNRWLDAAKVKWMTGGDTISTHGKYKDPVDWRPQFTLFAQTNFRPRIRHDDSGMWRRLREIPFLHQPQFIDTELKKRLRDDPDHQRVVLAWLVAGCLAWQADGLGTCAAVEKATAAYQQEMDPVGIWMAEECVLQPGAWEATCELRQSYKDWCEEAGRKPISERDFGALLKEKFGENCKQGGRGSAKRGYRGIRLSEQDQAELDLGEAETDPYDPTGEGDR